MPVPKQEYQQFLQEFMKSGSANMVDLNAPFCPQHGFGPLSKFHFQTPNFKCLSRHPHFLLMRVDACRFLVDLASEGLASWQLCFYR